MKSLLQKLAVGATVLAMTSASIAAEATKEQCVAFVQKAAAYVKANGKEKAMAEFSDPKGKFVEGDLYLFVYDLKGVNLAVGNGNANKMVGKNLLNLPDPDGKLFVKAFIDTAVSKGNGWVDYKFLNPTNKKIEPKTSYVEKVDDIVIGAGIYK